MNEPSAMLGVIRKHYPNALTTNEAVDRMFDVIEQRLGIAHQKLMFADSICSDDVNSIEYPRRAYEMLGPFKMGGLDGFPFTGLTGMGAFAHHVPLDGAVFVFHGPHIGVSKRGIAGEVLRPGQPAPSACCGAAKAALGKLQRGEVKQGEVTDLDYQQNTIEQIFLSQRTRILSATDPLKEATEVMYEASARRIEALAELTEYPCRYVLMMGGVVINSDHDVGSFVSLRRFLCCDGESDAEIDLLPALLAECGV